MLTKLSLLTILDALESSEAEFEELMHEKEWYVTSVTDRIKAAKEIVISEINRMEDSKHGISNAFNG